MKIISKFHDYYDTALGHGFDPTCVYERHTEEQEIGGEHEETFGAIPWRSSSDPGVRGGMGNWRERQDKAIEFSVWSLLFCGTVYKCYVLDLPRPRKKGRHVGRYRRYCWSPEAVEKALAYKHLANHHEKYQDDSIRPYAWGSRVPLTRRYVKGVFGERVPDPISVHQEHHCPVILYQCVATHRWGSTTQRVLNPVLKDIKFMKAVDPYTAFQEVAMYMSGVLGRPEMEHDPIPDEDMRDMKGFDEWSFKQVSPGERKRRRRNKKEQE